MDWGPLRLLLCHGISSLKGSSKKKTCFWEVKKIYNIYTTLLTVSKSIEGQTVGLQSLGGRHCRD